MPKFMKVDLLENLEKIMKKNTKSYQSDFAYDREDLEKAAAKADTVPLRERTYLWMSRRCGTWCLEEKGVFLKPTSAHHIWTYYGEDTGQKILAYAVEVTGIVDGKVMGNLYPINYREHVELVKRVSLPADRLRLVYEKGERFQDSDKQVSKEADQTLGRFLYSEYVPNDSSALEAVLDQEECRRKKMRCGKIENHIQKIAV